LSSYIIPYHCQSQQLPLRENKEARLLVEKRLNGKEHSVVIHCIIDGSFTASLNRRNKNAQASNQKSYEKNIPATRKKTNTGKTNTGKDNTEKDNP